MVMNLDNREEPLRYYFTKYGFDNSIVNRVVAGDKYLGLMLNGGQIGVCATLRNLVDIVRLEDELFPDLNNPDHRLIYTAYLNALLNYKSDYSDEKDIFDFVNFGKYKKVVMIGDFKPIVNKFQESELEVSVFDLYSNSEVVKPIEHREKYLMEADCVILTATSIFNGTFVEMLEKVGKNVDVFILGPTAILDMEMKNYRNVKVIFGTIFEKNDYRVLDVIAEGHGTRHFQKYGKKVYL